MIAGLVMLASGFACEGTAPLGGEAQAALAVQQGQGQKTASEREAPRPESVGDAGGGGWEGEAWVAPRRVTVPIHSVILRHYY